MELDVAAGVAGGVVKIAASSLTWTLGLKDKKVDEDTRVLDALASSQLPPLDGESVRILRKRELSLEKIQWLAKILSERDALAALYLRKNKIGDRRMESLKSALLARQYVIGLYLPENNLRKNGALHCRELMQATRTLVVLDLRENGLDGEAVKLIAEGLERNQTLVHLDLEDNSAQDQGAIALGKALKVNKSLVSLGLRKNGITMSGYLALMDAAREHPRLAKVHLKKNTGISSALREDLRKVLAARKRVVEECRSAIRQGETGKVIEMVQKKQVALVGDEDSLLHVACRYNGAEILRRLLWECGASPCLQLTDDKHRTPLDLANIYGQDCVRVIQQFLQGKECSLQPVYEAPTPSSAVSPSPARLDLEAEKDRVLSYYRDKNAEPAEALEQSAPIVESLKQYPGLRAFFLLYGCGIKQDHTEAYKYLSQDRSWDGNDHLNVSLCYLHGWGVKTDPEQARVHLGKALDLGAYRAALYLGDLFLAGIGGKKDLQLAYDYYQGAADMQVVGALSRLGFLYQWGLITELEEPNVEQAEHFYRQAIEMKDPLGHLNLSWLYRHEQKDPSKADAEKEKALKHYDPETFIHLGWLCQEGIATSRSGPAAKAFWSRSAEFGNKWAGATQVNLRPLVPLAASKAVAAKQPDLPASVSEEERNDLEKRAFDGAGRLQELEDAIQLASQQLAQMQILKAQLKSVTDSRQQAQIEQQLARVEADVQILMREHKAKVEKREEIAYFHSRRNLFGFYRHFQEVLEQLFVSAKAAQGKFVVVDNSSTGKIAKVGKMAIGFLGGIPEIGPALEKTLNIGADSYIFIDKQRQYYKAQNIARLGILKEIGKAVELAARALTRKYEWQIEQLATPEEVEVRIAEESRDSSLKKVKHGISRGASTAVQWGLCKMEQPFAESLAEFGALWICERLVVIHEEPLTAEPLHKQMVSWVTSQRPTGLVRSGLTPLKKVLEEIKVAGAQMGQVVSKAVGIGTVRTYDGQSWALIDIFTKPGIKTTEGMFYAGKGSWRNPKIYGYRLGTKEEAEDELHLKREDGPARADFESPTFPYAATPSKGPSSGEAEISRAWIEVQGARRLLDLEEENDELKKRVLQLEQILSPPKKDNAASSTPPDSSSAS